MSESPKEHSDEEDTPEEELSSPYISSEVSYSESDDDEEEERPVLKYKRFSKEGVDSIVKTPDASDGEKNVLTCIAVHSKFIALGTRSGTIKLLDHSGTLLKTPVLDDLHTAQINQISLDEEGEFLASCSNVGKVSIVGISSTEYKTHLTFDSKVKSIAIHPHFSKNSNRVFVVGTHKLVMIEERRWPLGNKTTELHGGYGLISTIKWKENLIAWANEKVVMIYDVGIKETIGSITYNKERLQLPFSLFWKDPSTLLVGRGNDVKTVIVEVDSKLRKKVVTVAAMNNFDGYVSGAVPILKNKQDWELVVLYYTDTDSSKMEDKVRNGGVSPPLLATVPPGWSYQRPHWRPGTTYQSFTTPWHSSRDKLLPRGYNFCRLEEYHLDCILGKDVFYILHPTDIILAEKLDATDHVNWLLRNKQSEKAVEYISDPEVAATIEPEKIKETKVHYIHHLIKERRSVLAARMCGEVLGPNDKKDWEDIILSFLQTCQLREIQPFIPIADPQLSDTMYELILNTFLQENCKTLHQLIKTWPVSLYSPQVILNAVKDKVNRDFDVSEDLWSVKALLHEHLGEYESAVRIYLQQGDANAFELISDKKLEWCRIPVLAENIVPLVKIDVNKAVKILVDYKADISPVKVIEKLEASGNEEHLLKYMDHLVEAGHSSMLENDHVERLVELYAKYEPNKVLPFLNSGAYFLYPEIPGICERYHLYTELAYVYVRMGAYVRALKVMMELLQDMNMAVDFLNQFDDSELWEMFYKSPFFQEQQGSSEAAASVKLNDKSNQYRTNMYFLCRI